MLCLKCSDPPGPHFWGTFFVDLSYFQRHFGDDHPQKSLLSHFRELGVLGGSVGPTIGSQFKCWFGCLSAGFALLSAGLSEKDETKEQTKQIKELWGSLAWSRMSGRRMSGTSQRVTRHFLKCDFPTKWRKRGQEPELPDLAWKSPKHPWPPECLRRCSLSRASDDAAWGLFMKKISRWDIRENDRLPFVSIHRSRVFRFHERVCGSNSQFACSVIVFQQGRSHAPPPCQDNFGGLKKDSF